MEKGIGSLIGESGRTISNMDRMMADQAARQGISPAEQRMMMIQRTASDMGRTISDRDAQLFGMGEISFAEAMSRAIPMVDMDQVAMERNLMQQQQLGFAKGDEVSKSKSKFPDLTGDGKVTQADILKGRGVFQEGDEVTKEKKSFTDFQPEGALKGTFFDFVPDMFQVSAFLKDKFGSQAADSETIRQRFNKAFSEARAEGKEVFMFMGKPYNTMTLEEVEGMAEGGAVEDEIEQGLEELQGVQPEVEVIQQVMTMVMEMIQSGASEEQIVAALRQMGLDDEDIQQVMMMVAEEMAGQESIDGQLAQMM
jgi:hypothetical protein